MAKVKVFVYLDSEVESFVRKEAGCERSVSSVVNRALRLKMLKKQSRNKKEVLNEIK